MVCLLSTPVAAHDWYSDTNVPPNFPSAGYGCCGGDDCAPLADGDATLVPGGYLIQSLATFVPNDLSQPGPDSHYHACIFPKNTTNVRCFFFPGPGT